MPETARVTNKGARRWAGGHALLGDTAYAFHIARPLDHERGDDVRLARCDAGGVTIEEVPLTVAWGARGRSRQPYPEHLEFGASLRLGRPRVIDANAGRVLYDASAAGETGSAYAEVDSPERGTPVFVRWAAR